MLERGIYSPYYTYFDVDWYHSESPGKVMVPFLGEDLDAYIKREQVHITFTENGFRLLCDQQEFPLSVNGIASLIPYMQEHQVPDEFVDKTETMTQLADGSNLVEWLAIKKDFINNVHLHPEYKSILSEFLQECSTHKTIIAEVVQSQPYLPVCYKITDRCMTYRRFFTINNLICLKMENEFVFNDYHKMLFELYKKNLIQGFRLDHIDGLYDPLKYVKQLRKEVGEACYIVVEKILDSNHEDLPENWCIEGTTGYEFLAFTNRVLTNEKGCDHLLDFYKDFTGLRDPFETIAYEKKHRFLYDHMQGELNNLIYLYEKLSLQENEIENESLQKALGIFMAAFPVYRIYPDQFPLAENEMHLVHKALERSVKKEPALQKEFEFIKRLFEESDPQTDVRRLFFIKRMMQYTGPLAAKGVEDTTFYIYNPLISHNEVGDSPSPLTYSVDVFHEKMQNRQQKSPYSLNTTSTHDTKRGENARARINALSYLYSEWIELVPDWHTINNGFIRQVKGRFAPSLNDEYFIYQSLLGSLPENGLVDDLFLERSRNFIVKALREAKTETNYDTPDREYENACIDFIEAILMKYSAFLLTFIPFLKKIIDVARMYSYAEIILKSTAPGIPDFYQGTEFEDLSYVDPDNRRAVDYNIRKEVLNEIQQKKGKDLFEYLTTNKSTGAEKIFITHKILLLRKKYPGVFLEGSYIPLTNQAHVLSYARQFENTVVMVLIPLSFAEEKITDKIILNVPQGFPVTWKNVFTEEVIQIEQGVIPAVFSALPLAVFECVE